MKKILMFLLAMGQISLMAASKYTCAEALQELMNGNQRFMKDASMHPDRTSERRLEVSLKQEPFACIVGCSDSRVSPEIIFDQGIGDLFIVRVAGNVPGEIEVESVEYSVHYLKSCIVLVLGHESCGAVNTVLSGQTHEIEDIAKYIKPAIANIGGPPEKLLENAIKANARATAEVLRKESSFAKLLKEDKLRVVAAYYNFHTGQVEILN